MKKIVEQLKQNNQDFEWYPTTKKMIEKIFNDYTKDKKDYNGLVKNFSFLDVGAGNGNVFDVFEELFPLPKDQYEHPTKITKFAIEKSQILINNMKSDVIIVGTDFEKQTLIDKKVDLIFSNPPYKRFLEWTLKVLKEANCNIIYLIIPERWKENKEIQKYIEKRKIEYKIIHEDDFYDSEYRQSRAKVNIIRFDIGLTKFGYSESDPFDIWFEENFKINGDKERDFNLELEEKEKKIKNIKELVKGRNLIEVLEELYEKDLEKLLNNYKLLEKIDNEIFVEIGVKKLNLKIALKEKIKGLKNFYWQELFDNLNKITNKLTSKSREMILSKLRDQTNIDFTAQNAYALVIWTLKNANIYIDEQLKDIYFEMADRDNIRLYKSNKKMVEDGWRYERKEQSYFKLDYRLVFKRYSNFDEVGYSSFQYPKGLYKDTHDFINDICTIAYNLGFEQIDSSYNFNWIPGKENVFCYGTDCTKEFMRVRAYKNGNIHVKFNQEFMKKLNIEMARINKWVKDIQECSNELEIDIKEVEKYFNCNRKLLKNDVKLLESGK